MLLNADVGESIKDKAFIPYLDIANVACTYHAGNKNIIKKVVYLAKKHQVKIAAHISYKDKKNFGRKSIFFSKTQLKPQLQEQLELLEKICRKEQYPFVFVKPHGALYNDAIQNEKVFEAIAEVLAAYNPNLEWVFFASLKNEYFQQRAKKYGLKLFFEVFADRNYENGLLMDRKKENAVFKNATEIVQRVLLLQKEGFLFNHKGEKEKLKAQTICFHGDNPASLKAIQSLKI